MEDKDRLGQKLHDKGKADEDRWIQQQEQERMRRLREDARATHGNCPRDGEKLVPKTDHELTVDICPKCGGVWLDRGDLETYHRLVGEAGVTRWFRSLLGV